MNGEAFVVGECRSNRTRPLDYLIVIACMVLIPSAVAQGIVGLDERTTFGLLVPVVLAVSVGANWPFASRIIPPLVFFLTLIGAVASILSQSFSQFLMGTSLAVAAFVGRQVYTTLSIPRVLRLVSWFTLAMLVGGVVGIVYILLGGGPLMSVQVGYRITHLYLTTFSFAIIGDTIIRPSGIFDEPGAFAMYVALVTMFNDTLRQNQRLTLAMMALMLFTGSLAGLGLFGLYFLSSNAMRESRKKAWGGASVLAATFLALSVVVPNNLVTTTFNAFYGDRLQIDNGRLAGDNRSNQVEDFFVLVDGTMLLNGATGATGIYDTEDMSSNPFSITYGYGLVISLPYFILLLWLASTTLRNNFRNSYTSLGLLFLLLQRPYLYHMSWSILILATVWLIYHTSRERRRC